MPDPTPVKPRSERDSWVVLALGANVGDRTRHLATARAELRAAGLSPLATSSIFETEPVGGPAGQARYLNQVVACLRSRCPLAPLALLDLCLDIERGAGRVRAERNAPRTLDIDILLFGDDRVDEANLIVPHPRMLTRRFVLEPLAEILPTLRHPRTERSFAEHLLALPSASNSECAETGRPVGAPHEPGLRRTPY